MAALATDFLIKGTAIWSGTIGTAGVLDDIETSIALTATAGLPTDTAVEITIDRAATGGTLTPDLKEVVRGVVSGNNIVSCVRGVEGTAQAHSPGALVELRLTADQWNRMITNLLVGHNQDGSHKAITATSVNNQSLLNNYSVAAQTPAAETRTYLTGSKITVPTGKLQIGTIFRWTFDMTKTAAGTAASTFDICFGTAGTTADTAIVSFAKPGGSGAADNARVVIDAIVRGPLTASGIIAGHFNMTHNLQITGHAVIPCVDVTTVSSAFDVTTASLKVGVCITSGASDAIAIQMVKAETWNL